MYDYYQTLTGIYKVHGPEKYTYCNSVKIPILMFLRYNVTGPIYYSTQGGKYMARDVHVPKYKSPTHIIVM